MAAKQGKVCTINRHLSKKSESGPILFTECNDEMETPVDKFASLTLDRELYKLDSARNVKVNYSVPIDSKSPWKMIKESPIRTMKVKLYLPPGQDHALNDNAQLFSNIVGVTETVLIITYFGNGNLSISVQFD